MKRSLLCLALLLCAVSRLVAQGSVADLIADARAHIDAFESDSAAALLNRALAVNSGATAAQRVRANILYGITQLQVGNVEEARQAFHVALQLDSTQRVDSMKYLEPALLREFNAERAVVAPVVAPAILTVDVTTPFDTTVMSPAGRLPIQTRPSSRARVVVTVAAASALETPVWTNIKIVDSVGEALWDLRGRDGALIPSGRYVLRVSADDSSGRTATPAERVLFITNPNAAGFESAALRVRLEEPLVFVSEPATTRAGRSFRVVVGAQDARGRIDRRFHDTVTVSITPGTGRIGAHLSGTISVGATSGLAALEGLTLDSMGTDYSLTASASGMTDGMSVSFDVNPGAPSQLTLTTGPANTIAGGAVFPIVVRVRDALGNTVSDYRDTVTVAIASSSGNVTGRLLGTTRVAAVAGVAAFPDLTIDSAGAGYALTVSTADIPPLNSSAFNVVTATWSGWASLSSGMSHLCGLTSDGIAYCWGANAHGELGDGSSIQRLTKAAVAGGLALARLTAGGSHTCGLTRGGTAYCWGQDSTGQLGDGSTSGGGGPRRVQGDLVFTSLSAGEDHTCGLTSAGVAYCWGDNVHGQLGDGTTTSRTAPVPVQGGLKLVSITAGYAHTCALTDRGAAYCWGWNYFGQLGDSTTTDRRTPVPVAGDLAFVSLVAGGANHTCGLVGRGIPYCWGSNSSGEIGDASTRDRDVPTQVFGDLTFVSLAMGYQHSCGLVGSGAAWCWGANGYGQLGVGTNRDHLTPERVAGGHVFTSLSAGGNQACGLTAGAVALCWGWNDRGQLGDGTTVNRNLPTAVLNR